MEDKQTVPSEPMAVFQYCVPVTTTKNPSVAFLWIPSQALQVRGVVIGGMTLMEREFSKDPQIRKACADQQLAIVFLKCGLGSVDLQKVLDDLAKVSGYRELSIAPLMFIGHSAGGPQAKDLAIRMANRCFGLVQYRGGVPGGESMVPPGVPVLMMIGQFDEFGGTMRNEAGRETWEGGRDAMDSYRSKNERNLGSIVVEPGAGHFAWSDRNAGYLAMWIRKAAQACIPETWSSDTKEPVALKKVDIESGWLTDMTIKASGNFKPAPYKKYKGDKSKAAWHFDKELAIATIAYHAKGFSKKDQFIKWTDSYNVDAGARFFFNELKWVGDGQTIEVHPEYSDKYPSPQSNGIGPKWFTAGKPVGHSDAPILVKQVSGPLIRIGPNTLRIQYDNLAPATEAARPTFMAYSIGNAEYRYTEQVGMMPRNFNGLTSGKDQIINFPVIGNLKKDAGPVQLRATSDSGLPCEYYVAYGPAVVRDGKLIITEIPARASFPIGVKVVAYQFGRGNSPLVKTAIPVEQTIKIEMP